MVPPIDILALAVQRLREAGDPASGEFWISYGRCAQSDKFWDAYTDWQAVERLRRQLAREEP